jgi:hypothetical protein
MRVDCLITQGSYSARASLTENDEHSLLSHEVSSVASFLPSSSLS